MTKLQHAYSERAQELRHAQQKLLRRISYMTMLQWLLTAFIIMFAGSVYNIYAEYNNVFWQLSVTLQLSIVIIPLVIGIILISLAVFTDASRANTQQMLELSTLHYDVLLGVHEAIDSYLGDTLPDYRKAMQGMDIGHEVFQTAQGYSQRLGKMIELTNRAIEQINLKGPLKDMKDLPAQARLVMKNAEEVLEAFENLPEHSEIEELLERLAVLLAPHEIPELDKVAVE